MRVILIAHTVIENSIPGYVRHGYAEENKWDPDADDLAEQAGRLCYLSWDRPNPKTATNRGYLANILAKQHFSVLEHASATFYIDGVSRNFTHELIRHRHLSFSEVSQRYVDVSEFKEVVPPALQPYLDEPMVKHDYFVEHSATIRDNYAIWNWQDLYRGIATFLINKGLSRKEARQAARYFAPAGLETKILVTGNMRAWRDVLEKRLSPTADKEFQLVAQKILVKLQEVSPNAFQDFEGYDEASRE